MNCDYSMYEGIKIKGNADTVLSRGEVIVFEKEFKGKAGRGNFVKRKTFGSAWNY
jgi:dihydropyrimidinase